MVLYFINNAERGIFRWAEVEKRIKVLNQNLGSEIQLNFESNKWVNFKRGLVIETGNAVDTLEYQMREVRKRA